MWRRNHRGGFRRALLGLSVLIVLAMTVAQVNGVMVPPRDTISHAVAASPGHDHRGIAASLVHQHDGQPRTGHELACCLPGQCPLLIVDVPARLTATPPVRMRQLGYDVPLTRLAEGLNRPPALPPPRTNV